MLAWVSVDYYVRMERGNLAGASESVLDGLASALQLDEAERDHLLALARRSGPGSARGNQTDRDQCPTPVVGCSRTPLTEREVEPFAQKYVAAINSGDVDALAALLNNKLSPGDAADRLGDCRGWTVDADRHDGLHPQSEQLQRHPLGLGPIGSVEPDVGAGAQ